MKARLLLLVALATASAEAQSKPSLGVELGYARSDFTGRDVGAFGFQEGALAGAYFRVPLTGGIAVQQGILISSKGGAITGVDTLGRSVRLELDLVYLDLPLLLRARVPLALGTRLLLEGGLAPGLRIGCGLETLVDGVTQPQTSCGPGGGDIRTLDVGVLGGVGVGIPIEQSELSLETRLIQGVRTVSRSSDVRNRSLAFLVSVPF